MGLMHSTSSVPGEVSSLCCRFEWSIEHAEPILDEPRSIQDGRSNLFETKSRGRPSIYKVQRAISLSCSGFLGVPTETNSWRSILIRSRKERATVSIWCLLSDLESRWVRLSGILWFQIDVKLIVYNMTVDECSSLPNYYEGHKHTFHSGLIKKAERAHFPGFEKLKMRTLSTLNSQPSAQQTTTSCKLDLALGTWHQCRTKEWQIHDLDLLQMMDLKPKTIRNGHCCKYVFLSEIGTRSRVQNPHLHTNNCEWAQEHRRSIQNFFHWWLHEETKSNRQIRCKLWRIYQLYTHTVEEL